MVATPSRSTGQALFGADGPGDVNKDFWHLRRAPVRIVDAMLNLDPGKLLVIAVVAVMVLGPDKLPHFARQVGGAWRSFNDFRRRMEAEVRSNIPDLPSTEDIAHLAKSPAAFLNRLSNMSAPADDAAVPSDLANVWDSVGEELERQNSDVESPQPGDTPVSATRPEHPLPAPMVYSGDAGLN
jgi:sec-independent protein translocase protein TatB